MLVNKRSKVLHRSAKYVSSFDEDLLELLDKMFLTMTSSRGIGIAAPQIGVGLRVALVVDGANNTVFEIVNPRITYRGGGSWKHYEGCLSLPGKQHKVSRYETVGLEYQDALGVLHRKTFSGLTAQIIQHEMDHLEGILIDDREKIQSV